MQNQSSHKVRNFIFGLALLGVSAGVSYYLKTNPPEAQREKTSLPILQVETLTAKAGQYSVTIESYGNVQARTQGTLTAQISGEIIHVAQGFYPGSFFEKGDILLEIDPRDYQTALVNASANVSQVQAALSQEQARSEQAKRDWQRLGDSGDATDLVLRKPQLSAARAELESRRAALEKSQLDLERTRVTAPYAGRIIVKNVDLGQYVSTGAQLAEIFAIDYVEVRLPLTSREYSLLNINESYRGENITTTAENSPAVTIQNTIGDNSYTFNGYISRSEGVYDTSTRQTYVIAQIDDPYSRRSMGIPPLKIGQFITANIKGKVLTDVYVVPNGAVYQGSYVYIVKDDVIERLDINLIWQEKEYTVIDKGIKDGDRVVTTSLNDIISGTKVRLKQP